MCLIKPLLSLYNAVVRLGEGRWKVSLTWGINLVTVLEPLGGWAAWYCSKPFVFCVWVTIYAFRAIRTLRTMQQELYRPQLGFLRREYWKAAQCVLRTGSRVASPWFCISTVEMHLPEFFFISVLAFHYYNEQKINRKGLFPCTFGNSRQLSYASGN